MKRLVQVDYIELIHLIVANLVKAIFQRIFSAHVCLIQSMSEKE